jgi:SAM-dependent methyltransferase
VPAYEHFARCYDELHHDDPLGNVERVRGYLARHAPAARAVLELGCGSGAILAGLDGGLSLTGIDRSPAMLARARLRVPGAELLEGDIATFDLGSRRFEAILCLFDTLNHLERFAAWRALFDRAADHLRDGGLLAFDVNTIGSLRRLAGAPPWSVELSAVTVTQWVEPAGAQRWIWHVRIRDAGEVLEERIVELGVPLDRLEGTLSDRFEILECSDESGALPSDESERAFYACRRRR